MNKRPETRLTIVDDRKPAEEGGGRIFEAWNVEIVEDIQDQGRTLKIFITK